MLLTTADDYQGPVTREMTDYEKARAWDALQNNFLAIEIEESNIKKAFNRKDNLEKKQRQLLKTGRIDPATDLVETCDLCGLSHLGSGC